MPNPVTERREGTRELLARTIVCLLCVIAMVLISIVVFRHALAIQSSSIEVVERVFLGVLGLAALITRFYFTGRR
jgi:uncharacterized protein YacL